MRKEFEMTNEQLNAIMDAGKSTPVMFLSGGTPMYDPPQENANRAWRALGNELGFDYITVRPVSGKHHRFFTAELKE